MEWKTNKFSWGFFNGDLFLQAYAPNSIKETFQKFILGQEAKEATDKVKVESVTAMKRYATDAIKEFAQVAACCEKALKLFDTEEKQ